MDDVLGCIDYWRTCALVPPLAMFITFGLSVALVVAQKVLFDGPLEVAQRALRAVVCRPFGAMLVRPFQRAQPHDSAVAKDMTISKTHVTEYPLDSAIHNAEKTR